MTDKEKLKSYYKYKPPLRFIKNKFFGTEHEKLYEDRIQILYLQYALQLLWVAEVVWIEDVRLSRSRVQDIILDELTVQDLKKMRHYTKKKAHGERITMGSISGQYYEKHYISH